MNQNSTEKMTKEQKEFDKKLEEEFKKIYQKTDALLKPKFKKKKFCNCCGKCCKSMIIPIMPLEAGIIEKKLRGDRALYERCLDYYMNQLRGGIINFKNCPYQLDNEKCGIYDIRPLVCRAWLSTKENCMGSATASGAIFDSSKIMNYYPEIFKDLIKLINPSVIPRLCRGTPRV
jgi:Fe-S-cluster containining protein